MQHYFDSTEDLDRIRGNFTLQEISYHARQCDLSGFLYHYEAHQGSLHFHVGDLTPAGHEFLEHIRNDSIWKSVLELSGKIGAKSLSAIAQVAKMFISELITHQVSQMDLTQFLP